MESVANITTIELQRFNIRVRSDIILDITEHVDPDPGSMAALLLIALQFFRSALYEDCKFCLSKCFLREGWVETQVIARPHLSSPAPYLLDTHPVSPQSSDAKVVPDKSEFRQS